MSVDVLSTVHATAVTLSAPAQAVDTFAAETASRAATAALSGTCDPPAGPGGTEPSHGETIAQLRTSRDLHRARARRLLAKLRELQLQMQKPAAGDSHETIDQYISRLLGRGAAQKAASSKPQDPASDRAKLAAMRELSQQNTKQLLDAHFRTQFIQLTISKGAIAPLAMLAGTGLMAMAQSSWPPAIYPAILCFSLAAVFGWQYVSAVTAPLRQRALARRMTRMANPEAAAQANPPGRTDEPSVGASSSGEKYTVAELLAELKTSADAPAEK